MSDPAWTFISTAVHPVTTYDVVWCHFPEIENPDSIGPKPRPALVRRPLTLDGNLYVEVAFGTSKTYRYSDLDLWISNYRDMQAIGLPQATIFQLNRLVVLPWAEEWFVKREDETGPVVGHLTEFSLEHLRFLLS